MALGKLVLRATTGGIMMGHGLQKLNGSFGGPGLEGTEKAMGAMGLHPARHQALAAALTETIGGGLTAAGLLSPLGPAMLIGTMAVAMKKVHLKNGLWIGAGGYEYNLSIIAAAVAIAAEGPGVLSVDGLLRRQRSGIGWAVLSATVGIGAAAVTLRISDAFAPTPGDGPTGPSGAETDGAVVSGERESVPTGA